MARNPGKRILTSQVAAQRGVRMLRLGGPARAEFEEALGNFLLAYNHIRPTKLTAEELEELTQTIHGRTMGKCYAS